MVSLRRRAPETPTDVPAAAPVAAVAPKKNANTMQGMAATTGAALLIGAGVLHYVLAPTHMAEARGQGLFFLVLATVQVVLGFLAIRHLNARVCYAAILASGASIAVYVIVTWIARPPFGEAMDEPDVMGYTTKIIELATLLIFVYLLDWRAKVMVPRPRRAVPYMAMAVVGSLLLGGATYAVGMAAEPVMPWLKDPEVHSHGDAAAADGHTHTHAAAATTDPTNPHAGHTTAPAA